MRWTYAAGGLAFDHPGFVHTVLVDLRARPARSQRPNRIFEVTPGAARRAGLVGWRRVLDSTPLSDAVATMDTVTLIRSAIRGLLSTADAELEAALRAAPAREDDYRVAGEPVCDYDDEAAREALVEALHSAQNRRRPADNPPRRPRLRPYPTRSPTESADPPATGRPHRAIRHQPPR